MIKKILAIDDQKDNLTTITAVIKTNIPDCLVLTALSGEEGIQIAQKEQPDTILLDIIMPGMDGYEVCKRLKEDVSTEHIPVIMITAIKTDSESRIRGLNIGADAFLSKPINQSEFTAQIVVMLRIKEAEDKLRGKKEDLEEIVKDRTSKLKESEEKYKALYDNAPLSYQSLDEAGNFLDVNPFWLKTLGYELVEVIGKNYRDFLHPDWKSYFDKNFPEFKRRGYVHNVHFKIQHKKGYYIDVLFEGCIGYNPDGSFKQTYCVFQDITEKWQTEESLKNSEEKLKVIFESAPDAIYLNDLKGNFLDGNKAAEDMLGYKKEELIGKNFLKLKILSPKELPKAGKSLAKSVVGIKTGPDKFLLNHKDGRKVQVEISTFPAKISGKTVVLGIARDITERTEAEKKTLKQLNLNKQILETTQDGYILADADGKIIDVNPAYCELMGYSPKEILKKNIRDIEVALSPEEIERRIQKMISLRKDHFLTKHKHKDGHVLDLDVSISIMDIDGNPNIAAFMRDITESKKAEDKIKEALIKAEESEKLKSAFLANMSHEIRTPMNAILGFSNLISEAETKEKQQEFIRIINSNGEHLLQIINDIIDVSQIEAGIIKIILEDCNINEIIEEVLDIYRIKEKIKNKNIELIFNKSLADDEANIQTDNQRLRQVLINLIDNAYKCTNSGKIEIGYSLLQNKNNNDYLEFYVKDTGTGIPTVKHKVIFDRFMQEDITTTRTIGGTGLGLTIARAIIKAMGGDIWLKSAPELGSTFYFTILYQSQKLKEKIIKSPQEKITDWTNKTILIAEDSDDSYTLLETILTESRIKIIRANNGAEAIDTCKNDNNIDLVLMDIRMPEVGGYQASIEIKKIRPGLPIIAQTAYAIKGDKETVLEAGCDDYISKPINPGLLMEMIGRWLN